ncbi:MAG: hypothetical protein IKN12_11525 [Selenomonadaceae bacterium]|nr:hypothetical protein [Selenomonadaceae bacterium]
MNTTNDDKSVNNGLKEVMGFVSPPAEVAEMAQLLSPQVSSVQAGELREVMVLKPPPSKIQPGECPILFLDGERNPDGTMKTSPKIEMPVHSYGSYTVLHADHRGKIYQQPLVIEADNPSDNIDFKHLGGKFYAGTGGYYYLDAQETYIPMTDFLIEVQERQQQQQIDGKVDVVVVVRLFDNFWEKILEIPATKWLDIFIIIEKECPERLVAMDEISNAKERFKRLASIILKNSNAPSRFVTAHWGWGATLPDGGRLFNHGGLPDCKSAKRLCAKFESASQRAEILRNAFCVLEVAPFAFTSPVLVYNAACYADALFTDAGFFLSHTLMLIGQSGLGKTSFVKAACSPFTVENERIVSVRSTEAAMYVEQEKTFDDVLLVDDFNREGSMREVQQKLKVMRALIRSYSDRTPRKKWVGPTESKGAAIRGGCVFTGETKMTGQLKSGELRYIKIFLTERIKGEKLQFYQSQPELILAFFSEWIRFLEGGYTDIVSWIQNEFPLRRQQLTELNEPRLIDAAVHLTLTADLMGSFLLENRTITDEECKAWSESFRNTMLNILRNQRDEVAEKDSIVQYVAELWNLIGTGKIILAPDLDTYCQDISHYGGYINDDVYMLKKDDAHVAVVNAYKAREDYFTESIEDVAKALKQRKLTRCDADGCLKRASSKIKGRPRMLALVIDKCEDYIKEENQ